MLARPPPDVPAWAHPPPPSHLPPSAPGPTSAGNMPDRTDAGWLPWLKDQRKKGVLVYMGSQCTVGPVHPELYKSGSSALRLGVESGPQMTPECATVKLMLCLAYRDLPLGMPLAGEL